MILNSEIKKLENDLRFLEALIEIYREYEAETGKSTFEVEGAGEDDGWKNIVGFEDCFKVDKVKPGVLVEMVEVDDKKN